MREILFRGKDIYRGKWIEGSYVHLNTGNAYICDGTVWIGTLQPCKNEVIPETVGQYTGLTDNNGNKIFEGDIARVLTGSKRIGIIKYDKTDACFYVDSKPLTIAFSEIYGLEIEVIGNIHDNPELLEQEG